MAYFNVCNKCGSHLDPGERCDCSSKSEVLRRKYEDLVVVDNTDKNQKWQQLVFNIKK